MGFLPFPAPLSECPGVRFFLFLDNCDSLVRGAELWDGCYRFCGDVREVVVGWWDEGLVALRSALWGSWTGHCLIRHSFVSGT